MENNIMKEVYKDLIGAELSKKLKYYAFKVVEEGNKKDCDVVIEH